MEEQISRQMGTQPAGHSLTLDVVHQSNIAMKLAELAKQILSGTIRSEAEFVRKDYVFFALADKSVMTFDAIQILCERFLVDDAFALIRVLIESVINGTYVSQTNDQIANDYADYPDFRDWIEFEQLRAVAPEITNNTPAEDVAEMLRKYEHIRTRYEKNQDWCADNLFLRASRIDALVGHGYNLMRTLVNLPWRKASTYVHGTAASIASRVRQNNSGVVIHRVFEPKEAAGVLFMASMALFALLALVDIRLGRHHENDWRCLYNEWGGPNS
jgi:hypothetical protein